MSIKLFKATNFEASERYFLAPSLYFTKKENQLYEPNSAIPNMPITTNANFNFINSPNDYETHNSLFFFKLDDKKIIDIAQNLKIQDIQSKEDLNLLIKSRQNAYEILLHKLNSFFKSYTTQPFVTHGIYIGGKEQITSTINFDITPPKKTGFHVDNWDKLPISELQNAANRICINLGKGHRYFLFINKNVIDIRNTLASYDNNFRKIENSNQIAKAYLMSQRPYQICFFKLAPFEGYIAPTENLVHDASNFDSGDIDIQLTARGYFKVPGVM